MDRWMKEMNNNANLARYQEKILCGGNCKEEEGGRFSGKVPSNMTSILTTTCQTKQFSIT